MTVPADVQILISDESNRIRLTVRFISVLEMRLTVSNAIKLIENALKEARQGAFRVRNCHDFEKMCMPNRRRRSA